MTDEGNITDAVDTLIAWLRKRGEPDSGINYVGRSHPFEARPQPASATLYGFDADFIAKHFHGQGARDLADALASRVRPAGEPVAWRWRWASADDWRVFGMSSTAEGRADYIRDMEKIAPIVVEPLYASPAPSYADAIREAVKAVNNHRPDASFDDSSAGYVERDALLKNIAAAIEALTPGSPL